MYSISQSSLHNFILCKWYWFCCKVLKLGNDTPSLPRDNGIMLHEVAFKYAMHLSKECLATDTGKLEKIFAHEIGLAGLEDDEYAFTFLNVLERHFKLVPGTMIGAELELAVDKNFLILEDFHSPDMIIRGIIDYVEHAEDNGMSGIYIRDYKFTWKTEYDAQIQIEMYAMMSMLKWEDAEFVDVQLWLIGRNIKSDIYRYYRASLPDMKKKYYRWWMIVNNTVNFNRTPHPDCCEYCPDLENCIQKREFDEEVATYKELTSAYIQHKAMASKLKSKLNKIYKQLDKDNESFTFVRTDSTVLQNQKELILEVIKNEKFPESYLTIPKAKAAKLKYGTKYLVSSDKEEFEKTVKNVAKEITD